MPQFDFFFSVHRSPSHGYGKPTVWVDVFPIVKMVIFKLVMLVFRDVQEVPRLLSLFEKRIWIYKVETSQSEKSSVWSLHSQVSTREDLVQMDPAGVLFTNFAIAMIVDDPPYFLHTKIEVAQKIPTKNVWSLSRGKQIWVVFEDLEMWNQRSTNWTNKIQTLRTRNYESHISSNISMSPNMHHSVLRRKSCDFWFAKSCDKLVQGSRVFPGIVIDGSHEDDIQLQRFHDGSLDKCHPRSPCHLHSEDLHLDPARIFLVWTKMWNKNHIKIFNPFKILLQLRLQDNSQLISSLGNSDLWSFLVIGQVMFMFFLECSGPPWKWAPFAFANDFAHTDSPPNPPHYLF